jgi:hypothetical protein
MVPRKWVLGTLLWTRAYASTTPTADSSSGAVGKFPVPSLEHQDAHGLRVELGESSKVVQYGEQA